MTQEKSREKQLLTQLLGGVVWAKEERVQPEYDMGSYGAKQSPIFPGSWDSAGGGGAGLTD